MRFQQAAVRKGVSLNEGKRQGQEFSVVCVLRAVTWWSSRIRFTLQYNVGHSESERSILRLQLRFPGGSVGKESACNVGNLA